MRVRARPRLRGPPAPAPGLARGRHVPPLPAGARPWARRRARRAEAAPARLSRGCAAQEGVELEELLERPMVFLDQCLDLLGEALYVGLCHTQAPDAEKRVICQQRLLIAIVRAQHLDDLPYVEATTDHPRATRPAAERDAGMQPRLRRLLGKLLDHDAARMPRTAGLVSDKHLRQRAEPDREVLCLSRSSSHSLQRSGCSGHHPQGQRLDNPDNRLLASLASLARLATRALYSPDGRHPDIRT